MNGWTLRLLAVAVIGLTAGISGRANAQEPATPADSISLMIAIYEVALTNGIRTAHAAALPELVCVRGLGGVGDPPQAVLDALAKKSALLVRPLSACRIEPLREISSVSLVVDTLTGKRGISISAGEPKFEPDGSFTVDIGYHQHGLSGASWLCEGRRRSDNGWEMTSCQMRGISLALTEVKFGESRITAYQLRARRVGSSARFVRVGSARFRMEQLS